MADLQPTLPAWSPAAELPEAQNTPLSPAEELAALRSKVSSLSKLAWDLTYDVPRIVKSHADAAVAKAAPKFYHSAALAPDELDTLFPAGYGDNIHWHVVCVGRRPGLYASAADADDQIRGVPKQSHKERTAAGKRFCTTVHSTSWVNARAFRRRPLPHMSLLKQFPWDIFSFATYPPVPKCNQLTRSGAVFAAPLELGAPSQRAVKLEAEDPAEYERVMALKDSRWEKGFALFSTVEELTNYTTLSVPSTIPFCKLHSFHLQSYSESVRSSSSPHLTAARYALHVSLPNILYDETQHPRPLGDSVERVPISVMPPGRPRLDPEAKQQHVVKARQRYEAKKRAQEIVEEQAAHVKKRKARRAEANKLRLKHQVTVKKAPQKAKPVPAALPDSLHHAAPPPCPAKPAPRAEPRSSMAPLPPRREPRALTDIAQEYDTDDDDVDSDDSESTPDRLRLSPPPSFERRVLQALHWAGVVTSSTALARQLDKYPDARMFSASTWKALMILWNQDCRLNHEHKPWDSGDPASLTTCNN
ncbi:hypothetical protein B0H14DRAFT_3493785 [Mycena olivaceomarginata]|nr:hypothetical protein B0H14DRAFT_3493785 [Mycena olivaceomarginata]